MFCYRNVELYAVHIYSINTYYVFLKTEVTMNPKDPETKPAVSLTLSPSVLSIWGCQHLWKPDVITLDNVNQKYDFSSQIYGNINNILSLPSLAFFITVQASIMRNALKNEIADCNLDDHWKETSYLAKIRNLNNFYDHTFNVKNRKFPVHKIIVGEASDVMCTMFLSGFKEAAQNSTKITDINPKVFEIMIDFIYGDREKFEKNATKNLMFETFEVAHMYNIKKLEDYCVAWIFKELTDTDDIVDTYSFACKYDIQELKKYCWEIIQL